ncbi:hypothetical protein LLH23_21020 [bacterium]|nr:hypothetical protein [bacterium]
MAPRSDYSDELPAIERYRIVLGAFLPMMPDAQKIIRQIRKSRGLCDPRDQDDLAENLRIVTPQALEPDVREALRRHRDLPPLVVPHLMLVLAVFSALIVLGRRSCYTPCRRPGG